MIRLIAAMSLVVALCLATFAAAEKPEAGSGEGPPKIEQLSAKQMIAKLDGPQESFAGLRAGNITFVELYLGIYRLYYTAEKKDEPVLLAAMLDKARPLERRLCLAAFLLDLNNEEAQGLIEACLSGKHGAEAKEAAALVLVGEGLSWRHRRIVRLLEVGARAGQYDVAWDALCRRAGELKLEEAVEPLIAILRRRPTDGEAALALGQIGDRRAIPILLQTIEHEGGVQLYHMLALQELDAPGLADILIRNLNQASLSVASSQAPFGVGSDCIDVLGDLDAKEAIEPLKKLLATSPDENLNGEIRLTLARLTAANRRELAERLLEIAETPPTKADDGVERVSAVEQVGATGQRCAIPRLLKLAKSSADLSMVHSAIRTIGHLGGDEAVAALVPLFDYNFSHSPQKDAKRVEVDYDRIVASALRAATGEDFGTDAQAWRQFLDASLRQ